MIQLCYAFTLLQKSNFKYFLWYCKSVLPNLNEHGPNLRKSDANVLAKWLVQWLAQWLAGQMPMALFLAFHFTVNTITRNGLKTYSELKTLTRLWKLSTIWLAQFKRGVWQYDNILFLLHFYCYMKNLQFITMTRNGH